MSLVEIASLPWGIAMRRSSVGDAYRANPNKLLVLTDLDEAPATIYATNDAAGATLTGDDLRSGSDGVWPGWVEEDTYLLTEPDDGTVRQVEAGSGRFAVGREVVTAVDSAAGIQAKLDTGRDVFFSDGVYVGSFDIDLNNDQEIRFGANAWIAPASGYGLKVSGNPLGQRARLRNPRIRINTGSTATRGIWIDTAIRVKIDDPVVWAFDEIPAGFVCIDVSDNAYWCEVKFPDVRKDSGTITTDFSVGVRFIEESNAGRVWGGNLAHCDTGVEIDGSNNCGVIGTAFEDCATGVEWVEPTVSGNGHGGFALFPRFESVTTSVLISQTTAGTLPWTYVRGMEGGGGTELSNPNSQPVYGMHSTEGINITGNDKSIRLRNGGTILRDASGSGLLETNGALTLRSDLDNNANGDIVLSTATLERIRISRSDGKVLVSQALEVDGALDHDGSTAGFYGTAPIAKQTGVGVDAASIHAALVALGLIGA